MEAASCFLSKLSVPGWYSWSCSGVGYSNSLFFNVTSNKSPDHFHDAVPYLSVRVVLCLEIKLVDGDGSTDRLFTLGKFYLTGASHGHPTQLFDCIQPKQHVVREPIAYAKLDLPDSTALKCTPAYSQHMFSPMPDSMLWVWVQPVSTRTVCLIPSIYPVIVDSPLFKRDLGRRLVPKSHPPVVSWTVLGYMSPPLDQ